MPRGNPSTVWSQLATPNSPVGSLPFVYLDGYDIEIDVLNFFYSQTGVTLSGSQKETQLTVAGGLRVGYTDTTSVPGAATINKPAGRVKLAAGQTSLVVTNNFVFASSIIRLQIEGAFDATAQRLQVTAQANGSFTISANAAATGALTISFEVVNVF
jgi:hypothetical protein